MVRRHPQPFVIAVFASLAVVVGSDGQFGWRCLRVLAVGLVAALAVLALGGPGGPGGPDHPGRRAGLVLWWTGVVGLIVGLGIGVRHLMEGDVGLTSLAGLAALIGGLGAAGIGLAAVTRAAGRRMPFVAAFGLVLAGLIVGWVTVPALMATNVPRTSVGDRDPADLGIGFEEVTFPSRDGVRLSAWYVPSRNGAAVVLRHGAGSTRSATLDHLGVLAAHGFGVLATDARGHGRSSGRAMDFGWYGDADIHGAVTFLIGRGVEAGRIGIVGLSMGGEEAVGAAGADERIGAVVAEGATGRSDGDKVWLSDVHGLRGRLQRSIEWVQYSFTDLLTAADKPTRLTDAVRRTAPRPVLLIAAGNVDDEQQAALAIQRAAPSTVTIWVVEGAGHTGGLRTAPQEWERRVVEVLTGALLASG